ncbi:DUF547 domain-containing protein [Hahella ganghwensis]|uniref:DUF547 domain-containing protein n=1 Tax=Hahella ganghwensis TaxID=286420 RepID=UPI00036C935A|nr:DUF547 domain-containing protein [Hahella ganghwensis]
MILSQWAGKTLLVLTTLLSMHVFAADTDDWRQSDELNRSSIDHSRWNQVLATYLDVNHASGVHLFRYSDVTSEDHKKLSEYLHNLAELDPREFSRAEQKAYWINLYNALTVKLILKHYPVESITDLGETFFAFGPWDDDAVTVAGEELTLNDIEHQILRPIWQDPRIHYAVNCASFSCPNLASEAYTSTNLERLLEQGATSYINHERGVDLEGDELVLSSIYKWYQEDFGKDEQDVLRHLSSYARPDLKKALEGFDGDIDYEYDWRLNELK